MAERSALWIVLILLGTIGSPVATAAPLVAAPVVGVKAEPVPHVAWTLPFVALLLAIALLPLMPRLRHWWEDNLSKLLFALVLGELVLIYYGVRGHGYRGAAPGVATVLAVLEHALVRDYVPFIFLLLCLYVVAGGLQVKGNLQARPVINTSLLAFGAVSASLIGTTGASMILIRPLLQTNRDRRYKRHTVVFFIFLVSNIGGSLLPTGDPPLFLGYLQGVPFLWTLRLAGPWAFCVIVLLTVYFAWDSIAYAREAPVDQTDDVRHCLRPRLHGKINLVWLLGTVLAVGLIVPGRPLPGTAIIAPEHTREGLLAALAALSLVTTPRNLRREVEFTYSPFMEVACLFLGIFVTMQVSIEILQTRGVSLGLNTPAHFFWAAGGLSSILDNAPTYLVFFETAKTLPAPPEATLLKLAVGGTIRQDLLAAISLGAVFMGANTYIGNGPNLLVRAIAEERGVAMPSFLAYLLYSSAVLGPLFVATSFLFLS